MKRVAILQSNYIPWKGYFDIIASVDEFIIYDCVQYTKNDWRNRNQIKTAQGKAWLTIPARQRSLEQTVEETEIADVNCFRKHWNTFRQAYAKASFINYCDEHLRPVFTTLEDCARLSEVNATLIRTVCSLLSISTVIRDASEYEVSGNRNERLIRLCQQAGADRYLSGQAARDYLDEPAFAAAGVAVDWMDYSGYPVYQQPHPPFDHYVSVLDLLACTGPGASSQMLHTHGTQR